MLVIMYQPISFTGHVRQLPVKVTVEQLFHVCNLLSLVILLSLYLVSGRRESFRGGMVVLSPADEVSTSLTGIVLEAAMGQRLPTAAELRRIQEHVAEAWYSLSREQRISRELFGTQWGGRVLQTGDALPTDVVHYLKHAVAWQEWPPGVTFAPYRECLRDVILDPAGGLMTSRYRDKGYPLSIVRRSRELQGPGGHEWLLVEYRVSTGYIATAFQPEEGLGYLDRPGRRRKQWLRKPQ